MKKTKVLLAGALVLALGLVMGCKQNEELSVEEHRKGENGYQHVWEAEYTGDNYYRSALQFGSGKMDIQYAKVRVKMNYPGNGKAGLLFATNEREVEVTTGGNKEKKKLYDFYAFAFGKNPRATNTLEAYVDYYVGLEKFNDASSTSERFGTGTNTPIVAEKNLENISWNGASPVTVDMIIEKKTTTGGSGTATVTYNLKIQSTDGNTVYWTAENVAATGESVVNEGYLCSYGMVSKLADPKKVDTVWTLDKDSLKKTGVGTILAAEEE